MSFVNYLQSNFVPTVGVPSTTTLTAAQSGSIVLVPSSVAAVTITLPSPVNNRGVNYKILFCNTAALANIVTITAPAAKMVGSLISSNGTPVANGAMLRAAPRTSIACQVTINPGDSINLWSEGGWWHVLGFTAVHGSMVPA